LIVHVGVMDMEAQMKINGAAVRALREQKSWSQEHLASAAGLSVRTVQRVEVQNLASAETRLALAAALGVPVADLMPPPASTNAPVEDRRPPIVANWGFEAVMRKTLLGLGVVIAFVFALVVLFNALSGFLPQR
jgi:transcriptional regulator with XRE-family HTH domain